MVKRLLLLSTIVGAIGCGSSSPSAPTPAPITPPVVITPAPSPAAPVLPVGFDAGFWAEFGHGILDNPGPVPLRRLTSSPTLYIRTVDDDGVPVDPVTLNTVKTAAQQVALLWGGGQFGLAAVMTDPVAHDGQRGTISVHFSSTAVLGALTCGRSNVGIDGGVMALNYHYTGISCGCNGTAISPHVVKHELGHAFGYWHTDHVDDIMDPVVSRCDDMPSAREVLHAVYAYQLPIGSTAALPPSGFQIRD